MVFGRPRCGTHIPATGLRRGKILSFIMVAAAKQIKRDKSRRDALYFDVPEKAGIVSVIGADTDLGDNIRNLGNYL